MLAFRLMAQHKTELTTTSQPEPGPGEVLLKVGGATPTLTLGASVVATGGRLTLVGVAGGSLKISPNVVGPTGVPFEARIVMPFWGTRAELAEVIALAQAGAISAHIEKFPLSNAPVAYENLQTGKLKGRAVILPAAFFGR